MLDIEEGTEVRVYWNLHKECYSVQTKRYIDKYTDGGQLSRQKVWRVFGHCDNLQLDEPRFKVSKAGNQRVRDEGKKNVHAYIRGYWTTGRPSACWLVWTPVRYNPYRYTDFMSGDPDHRTPIHQARYAILNDWGKIWAIK